MFIKEEKVKNSYYRKSKLGHLHQYTRSVTTITLQCDNCGDHFIRDKGAICSKRRSNLYYHCCAKCDAKKFAQIKSVEKRMIWNMPVSSTITLDKF